MIINIEVKNRIATYRSTGSDPVCGSNTDQVRFTFDAEWDDIIVKTARFIWGDQYHDEEFRGDTCPVPMFSDITKVYIGVYAGEPVIGEPSLSTTKAEVPYGLSVRCGYTVPSPQTGESFTNQAKGYAMEAKAAVDDAREVIERAQEVVEDAIGMKEFGRLTFRLRLMDMMGEDGWYYSTWHFQNKFIDVQNGAVLLTYGGDFVKTTQDMILGEELIELMRCPLTRIQLTHLDLDGVLTLKTVYDGISDGEAWKRIQLHESSDGTDVSLPDEEWPVGGVRLVSNDNPYAPGSGYGPWATFLQFSKEFKDALEQAILIAGCDYDTIELTFIGYC